MFFPLTATALCQMAFFELIARDLTIKLVRYKYVRYPQKDDAGVSIVCYIESATHFADSHPAFCSTEDQARNIAAENFMASAKRLSQRAQSPIFTLDSPASNESDEVLSPRSRKARVANTLKAFFSRAQKKK